MGLWFDSPIPLIPYIYYKTCNQDFTQKLVTYLIDQKCGGTVDVTGMNMEDVTKLVKDLVIEIDKEIAQYFKLDPFYMGIDSLVKRATTSKELHFSHASDYSIQSELKEIALE